MAYFICMYGNRYLHSIIIAQINSIHGIIIAQVNSIHDIIIAQINSKNNTVYVLVEDTVANLTARLRLAVPTAV